MSTLIKCYFKFAPDDGGRQRTAEAPAFHSCSASGESETSDSSFPRLRRGRRRADEARLDLWGFATPSPPPPPVPTPPSPPPTALISAQPARRPRGRPRSTPLPERASRRTASEAETPAHLKRQRCRSKKYQTGEYITDRVKLEDGEHLEELDPLQQHNESPAGRQIFLHDFCFSNAERGVMIMNHINRSEVFDTCVTQVQRLDVQEIKTRFGLCEETFKGLYTPAQQPPGLFWSH